ncbi:MAG: dTDP-glucose 4,6-dehydratase [Herbinix sp.]|nr:dTDP-glucose 4,6-dehydratase [Herbinix sp.]
MTDHCKAIDKVLHLGKVGEVYNVGGHNEYTNLEILTTILTILKEDFNIPDAPIKFVMDRKCHDKRYAIDPSKIMNELGWKPETNFNDGIRKALRWYIENKSFLEID